MTGVQGLGKAELDDKTMVDALTARPSKRSRRVRRRSLAAALGRGRGGRSRGRDRITPLVARKGRASYLGERARATRTRARPRHDPLRGLRDATRPRRLNRRTSAAQEEPDAEVRRRPRPGHDQHPLHDLRPRRAASSRSTRRSTSRSIPKPGWVEHDPAEIWARSQEVISGALDKAGITAADLAAVGITNQRETAVVWDKNTGKAVYNAIVWQDTRTDVIVNELAKDGGQDRFRAKTGLPLATYFSGPKVKWILDNVDGARAKAEAGDLLFGNIDTWCIWNLTGGPNGGVHVTDVTNASRTLLINLETLTGTTSSRRCMGIPKSMLPAIKASSEVYGTAKGDLEGIPIAGDLGDQQAALFGQACFDAGEAKNTYGTGCFMLLNTGTKAVPSKNGLLTTLGYKIGDQPAVYALEGSIAITGALVQWLRDNLGLITSSAEVEALAATVEDNGGVYFVPAFSGLFAPYWKNDARGVIAGLTRYVNKGHIARADARGDRLADPRGARRDERRLRRRADGPQGRRRHGLQRAAHAVPGRRPRRAGHPAAGRRDDRPRRGLRGRPGRRLLEHRGRPSPELGEGQGVVAEDGRGPARQGVRASGRRPSPAPSTGSNTKSKPGVPAGSARRHANLAEDQDRCPSPGPRRSSGSSSYPIPAASRRASSSLPARWRGMTSRSRRWVARPTARSARTPTASPQRSAVRITARGS